MTRTTMVVEPVRTVPEVTSLVHDLRNPLSAILGGAELLISSRLSEPQVQRIAYNLYGSSMRMKELLDEILTRYRGATRGVDSCDVRDMVTSAVDQIALVAEAQSVQIVQNVLEELVIAIDRPRIQRVLVNLLVNALDVMPGGGIIRISAIPEHHSVMIKVRDTGPGISPELHDRLFEPFATAGKVRGLGLGLYFSRQAVIDHGGQMWVDSGSHGACFAFRLPTILKPYQIKPTRLARKCDAPAELSAGSL
jgi:signal transduction histidine kinase